MIKNLKIELIDGRKIIRDITAIGTGAPIGAPANDPAYAQLCQAICVNGYTDIDKISDKNYTHIAPSQIKSVSVQFI